MIYEDYMEDFLKEARQEMYDYLREAGKSKEDVYKINYYMDFLISSFKMY